MPGRRLPAGRDVDQDEPAALIEVCRHNERPSGVRDAAVIALAYLSGARRAEIAALHVADVDLEPPAVRVVGKGNKQRLVPLSPSAGPFLAAWLELRGEAPGPLFCRINRAGNLKSAAASPARRSASSCSDALSVPASPASRPTGGRQGVPLAIGVLVPGRHSPVADPHGRSCIANGVARDVAKYAACVTGVTCGNVGVRSSVRKRSFTNAGARSEARGSTAHPRRRRGH